jgi:hypothetical protein
MKYKRLAIFIRHDTPETLEFWYGLTLGIGTLKFIATTGVFVRVFFDLKHLY